jgi:hypothetical protein
MDRHFLIDGYWWEICTSLILIVLNRDLRSVGWPAVREAADEVLQRRAADVPRRLSMWLLTIVAYSSMKSAASSSGKSSAA